MMPTHGWALELTLAWVAAQVTSTGAAAKLQRLVEAAYAAAARGPMDTEQRAALIDALVGLEG